MTWPQIVVAVLMAIGLLSTVVTWSRDRDLSSGDVTVRMFMMAAYYTAYAWVLHEGGFW